MKITKEGARNAGRVFGALVMTSIITCSMFFYDVVRDGEVGITRLWNGTILNETLPRGMYVFNAFKERVNVMKIGFDAFVGVQDVRYEDRVVGQVVIIVKYNVPESNAVELFKLCGNACKHHLIIPAIYASINNADAERPMSHLASDLDYFILSNLASTELTKTLSPHGIVVESLSVRKYWINQIDALKKIYH